MNDEPRVEQRAEQPYAGIRMRVTMNGLSGAVDQGFPELFGWLAEHGIALAAPPFIRYHVIDMDGELEIELGAPAGVTSDGGTRVRPGILPGGR
jgi:hypothetical protein